MSICLSKNILASIVIALFSLFSSGCITSQVIGDKFYEDVISGYLISQDHKSAVVLSNQYTYVFELDEQVQSILDAPYRDRVEMRIPRFTVSSDGLAVANYTILLDHPSLQNRGMAIRDGFKADGVTRLYKAGQLSGHRYEKSITPDNVKLERFNQLRKVIVAEQPSTAGKVAQAAVSPVAAAADGMLMLFGVPLFAAHVLIRGHE